MKQSSDLGFKLCERDACEIIEREATYLATVTRTVGDFYGHHCMDLRTSWTSVHVYNVLELGLQRPTTARTVGVDEHML